MGLDPASRQPASASPQTAAARTILVMAGGTGGHVMPALAVAERMRRAGWRVVWLGSRDGMEATLIPKHGYEMEWIRFSGVRGKGFMRMALLPLNLLVAFWQSARVIFRVRPDVVLGMGGYVSFPGAMMASLLDRPLVVHEQNSVAGLANRVLAGLADRILCGFPGVLKKSLWVGNPVRESITHLPDPATRYASRADPLQVLVLGGSLGAQALNEVVPAAMRLVPEGRRPRITHQSGVKHLEHLRRSYEQAGIRAEATPFIDDMAAQYAQADLVICRAGALTVSELAAAGVASVLVPFPHAVDDHQTHNARFLVDAGAAVLVQQRELSPRRLADLLLGFTREQLAEMAKRARAGQARGRCNGDGHLRGVCRMSSEKEENVMQPKVNKQVRRRGDPLRLRLPARTERTPRRQDLGDLRLQFLLEATSLSR